MPMSDSPPTPPRLCKLVKETPDQEYGFNLHAEKGKGQFVGTVDRGSIADRAGLRSGDRIHAVNGTSIKGETHKRVVQRITERGGECELLVATEETSTWYTSHGREIDLHLPNIERLSSKKDEAGNSPPPATWYAPQNNGGGGGLSSPSSVGSGAGTPIIQKDPVGKPLFVAPAAPVDSSSSSAAMSAVGQKPRPRLCRLEKTDVTDEFGFNLHAEKNKGHFIGTVDKGGIGDLSGLRMGQRIVGVNGALVYPQTPHKEVVALIKRSPLKTELLVASEDVDRWYKDHREEYSFDYIESTSRRPTISEPIPQPPPQQQLSPHSITVAPSDSAGSSPPVARSSTSSSRSSSVAAVVPPVPVPVKVDGEEDEDHKHDQHPAAVVTTGQDQAAEEEEEEEEEQTDELTTVVEKSTPAAVHHGEDDLMTSVFGTTDPPQSHQHDDNGDDDSQQQQHPHHHHHEVPVDVGTHEVHEDKNVAVAASPPLQPLHNNNNHNNNGIHQHHATPVYHHHPHQNEKGNGVPGLSSDIFGLSAAEARERLRTQNRRRDPRQQALSMDEKHRLIANL